MNLSTAVFLLPNTTVRAIMVTYESYEMAPKEMFKTFDQVIKKDDYVVVPTNTRHNLTVCKVVDVDVDVDFDSATQVSWIVGRIDMADVTAIKKQESAIIDAVKAAEKLKKKKELSDSMSALIAAGGGDIKMLSIHGSNEDVALDEPKVA